MIANMKLSVLIYCLVAMLLFSAPICSAINDSGGEQNKEIVVADNSTSDESAVFIYKSAGRRDPFVPLVDQLQETTRVVVSKPRGPLQQYELTQFRLMAVLIVNGRPMAMVKAPDGKSYSVKIGDEIGRYEGKVSKIETKLTEKDVLGKRIEKSPDRIIIDEIVKDNFTGKQIVESRFLTM